MPIWPRRGQCSFLLWYRLQQTLRHRHRAAYYNRCHASLVSQLLEPISCDIIFFLQVVIASNVWMYLVPGRILL